MNELLPQIIAHSGSTKQYIKRHIEQLQMSRIKHNSLVPGRWAVVSQKKSNRILSGEKITKEEVSMLIDQYIPPPQIKDDIITL